MRHNNGYPIKIERGYYRKLARLVKSWRSIAQRSIDSLKPYIAGGTKILQDADNSNDPNWTSYVQQALDLFSTSVQNAQTDSELHNLATQFIYSVSAFSAGKELTRHGAVKVNASIVALNPLQNNAKLQEYAHSKIIENTNLIKTMRQRFIDQLKNDIYVSINSGGGVSDLAHVLAKRTGMTLRHADLIATDQTGKILSQIDAYRAQSSGSTKYVWRSMEDKRVRPKHRQLDGKTFKYDDPNGGDNGQLPGEPIRCRCYADPID